jgi:hypothetical protein
MVSWRFSLCGRETKKTVPPTNPKYFRKAACLGLSALLVVACAPQMPPALPKFSDQFVPPGCGFSIGFPEHTDDKSQTPQPMPGVLYKEWNVQSIHLAALCLPGHPTGGTADLDALNNRLQKIAAQVGVEQARFTIPTSAGPLCGEIDGRLRAKSLHTLICLTGDSEFVAETLSDGSDGAERVARAFLESTPQPAEPNPPAEMPMNEKPYVGP